MCLAILPLLGLIASVGQAAAGYAAASQQADEQNAYYESNRRAAIAAANDKYASINNNTIQEKEAASQKLFEQRIEALRAESKAKVSAGEAGITGLSVDAILGDIQAQQGRRTASIETNFENVKERNVDESVAMYHQTVGRINSVRQASKPSALPFIIQGIGGIAGAAKGANFG